MKLNRQKGMTLIELTVVLLVLIAMAGLAIPYVGGTSRMALCQATDASMQAVKSAIMGGGANAGFYMDTLGFFPQNTRNKQDHSDYSLRYLFEQADEFSKYNPKTAVGWRGPYLMSGAKISNDLEASFSLVYHSVDETAGTVHTDIETDNGSYAIDAWGRPIIIQIPYDSDTSTYKPDYARLVSAGVGQGLGAGNAAINTKIEYDSTVGNGLPDASDRSDDRVLYLRMPDPYADGNQPCDS